MVNVYPGYYSGFRCIADKCKNNCCIGWEIDIDKESYDEVVELLPKDFIVINGDNDFSDYQNRAYFKNFERIQL